MTLRRSSFTVDCGRDSAGKRRYFNTLSRKFISLPEDLESLAARPAADARVAELLQKGHWLTSATSYQEEMREDLRLITSAGAKSRSLNVVFTVTTRCNLSCSYCFQNNTQRLDASGTALAALPAFIGREAAARPSLEKVSLSLFGGEPLLMEPACLGLLDSVRKECAGRSLKFEGGIVTNGLGASAGFWEAAAAAGLRRVQVTLDGAREVHDGFRRLDGKGTYAPLLALCAKLSETLHISLKYNLNRRSAACFEEFAADLRAAGLKRENTRIVLEAVKAIDYNEAQDYYFASDSSEAGDAYLSCAGAAMAAGWSVQLTHVFQPPCMYTQTLPSSIVIRPDGEVSRCISVYNDDPDFTCGNIASPALALENKGITALLERGAAKCAEAKCPLFPICLTGCPSAKKQKFGNIGARLCRRPHMEKFIAGLAALQSRFGKEFSLLEF